jgi:hypothetical protein
MYRTEPSIERYKTGGNDAAIPLQKLEQIDIRHEEGIKQQM